MTTLTSSLSYQQSLIQAGLSEEQALIYEYLVKNGPQTAGKISTSTPLKRGLVYKILDNLVNSGLAIKHDSPGKVAIFEPAHPLKLKELAEKKEADAKNAQEALKGVLEKMTIDYNLISGRPGVKFYEGIDGITNIYDSLLEQGKPIDSFEDKGEMIALIPEYAKAYPKRRVKLGITNRVIAPSDNPINQTDESLMRETRFIPTKDFPFRMDVKIAGRLVSLITFQKENPVGVLIDNQEIAENFRILFEMVWKTQSSAELKTAIEKTEKKDISEPKKENEGPVYTRFA